MSFFSATRRAVAQTRAEKVDTDPQLILMIEEFLHGRGDVKVAPLERKTTALQLQISRCMDFLLVLYLINKPTHTINRSSMHKTISIYN